MPKWNQFLRDLSAKLARLYYSEERAVQVVRAAGIDDINIDYSGASFVRWFNILDEILRQQHLPGEPLSELQKLVSAVALQYPGDPFLRYASSIDTFDLELDSPNGNGYEFVAAETTDGEYEAITGEQSTLIPIATLAHGHHLSRSVALVRTPIGSGTGFLLDNNVLVTNHHVLPNVETADAAEYIFNYQYKDLSGISLAPAEVFRAEDSTVNYGHSDMNSGNDWAVVKLAPNDSGTANSRWGHIDLVPLPIGEPKVNSFTFIIQHPGGRPKEIGMFHNTVVRSMVPNRVCYLTDTLRGASGSPVFNERWQVIALHHWGQEKSLQTRNTKFAYNRGIHVNSLISDLRASRIMA